MSYLISAKFSCVAYWDFNLIANALVGNATLGHLVQVKNKPKNIVPEFNCPHFFPEDYKQYPKAFDSVSLVPAY